MAKRRKNPLPELVLLGAANPRRVEHDDRWKRARSALKNSRAKNPASRWAPARAILQGGRNPLWVQFKSDGYTYRTDGTRVEAKERGGNWTPTGSHRIWLLAMDAYAKHTGTFANPSIYEALKQKLGREPSNAELKAEISRIKTEGLTQAASQGKLPHQRRRRNSDAIEKGAELYEQFHGKSPEEIVAVQEADTIRKTYTALGDLVELRIQPEHTEQLACIKFGGDGVKLASAPGGRQLYLIGGDQGIDGSLDVFGTDASKDFVELGRAVYVMYRGRKSMDNFALVDYYHELGEESGQPPFAFYDRLRRRIFFVGGNYHVEAPGIID